MLVVIEQDFGPDEEILAMASSLLCSHINKENIEDRGPNKLGKFIQLYFIIFLT